MNLALESEEPFKVTIAREKLTWLKMTMLPDFKEITDKYAEETGIEVYPDINIRRPEQIYYFNGCEFAFFGLDDPKKLHGRKQNITWLNEVMEISRDSFDQLEFRTTDFMILDYNPSDEDHWVFDLDLRDDVLTIKSTILDNPYIEPVIRNKILGLEPTPENIAKGTADNYLWEVYGLGNKAKLQGLVFENWDVVDSIPDTAKRLGLGQDFGYTNDPSTLIDVYISDNEIYLDEVFWETNLTNSDIANKYEYHEIPKTIEIMADSSEPKSIEEIYRHGYNIKGVEKGSDSINFGISIMKKYKIHVTKRSVNLEKEFRKYKWSEDKNGKSLNKPIDKFNHGIDAARYAIMTFLRQNQEVTLYHASILDPEFLL